VLKPAVFSKIGYHGSKENISRSSANNSIFSKRKPITLGSQVKFGKVERCVKGLARARGFWSFWKICPKRRARLPLQARSERRKEPNFHWRQPPSLGLPNQARTVLVLHVPSAPAWENSARQESPSQSQARGGGASHPIPGSFGRPDLRCSVCRRASALSPNHDPGSDQRPPAAVKMTSPPTPSRVAHERTFRWSRSTVSTGGPKRYRSAVVPPADAVRSSDESTLQHIDEGPCQLRFSHAVHGDIM
jgi:hypothetical protein